MFNMFYTSYSKKLSITTFLNDTYGHIFDENQFSFNEGNILFNCTLHDIPIKKGNYMNKYLLHIKGKALNLVETVKNF